MTTDGGRTWVVTLLDPRSGGWLTEIAVRAHRASSAVRIVRDAGVHKRSMHPGASLVEDGLPWPSDPAVVFLRRGFGLGEDAEWRPVTGNRLD